MRRLLLSLLASIACAQQASPPEPPPSGERIEEQNLRQLLTLRRVYVDRFSGGETAQQIRDMVIAALARSRLFVVTEEEASADAYLRGSAEDLVFTEVRASREGINARGSSRAARGQRSAAGSSSSASVSSSLGVGENEDHYSRERKHEATAAIRLVARNGDVLWSTTQESLGAKFKGSSADVADKIARDLAATIARARKLAGGSPTTAR